MGPKPHQLHHESQAYILSVDVLFLTCLLCSIQPKSSPGDRKSDETSTSELDAPPTSSEVEAEATAERGKNSFLAHTTTVCCMLYLIHFSMPNRDSLQWCVCVHVCVCVCVCVSVWLTA